MPGPRHGIWAPKSTPKGIILFRAGPAAGDNLDQLLAVEAGLVQVRRLARRARIAVAVAVDAVAELAIRLVVIEAVAEGDVFRRILCARHIGARQQSRQSNNDDRPHARQRADYTCRSTIICLISAMALAGLRLFGQALAQFMMVWQR